MELSMLDGDVGDASLLDFLTDDYNVLVGLSVEECGLTGVLGLKCLRVVVSDIVLNPPTFFSEIVTALLLLLVKWLF
jgi:hypothetical protein